MTMAIRVFSRMAGLAVLAAGTALGSGVWAQQTISFVLDENSPSGRLANQAALQTGTIQIGPGGRTFGNLVFTPRGASAPVAQLSDFLIFPSGTTLDQTNNFSSTGTVNPTFFGFLDSSGNNLASIPPGSFFFVIDPFGFQTGGTTPEDDFGTYSFVITGDVAIVLTSNGASAEDALALGTSSLARGTVVHAGGVAATRAQLSFVRDRDAEAIETTGSTRGAQATGVNTWVELTGFVINGNDLRQSATGFQLGGDIHVTPNVALGLSVGHNEVNSTAGGFDLSGDLTFIQPYAAYVSGQLRAEASLIYGRGDFDQVSLAGAGSADSSLIAATLSGAYDMVLSTGQTFSPIAALSYGEEEVDGTGGTLAGTGSDTTSFGRASIGARLITPFETGSAFVGLHADYDYSSGDTDLIAGFDDDTGLAGRLELGVDADVTDRLELRATMSVGGLGRATRDVAAGVVFGLTF
jgi:hypothetical protein